MNEKHVERLEERLVNIEKRLVKAVELNHEERIVKINERKTRVEAKLAALKEE